MTDLTDNVVLVTGAGGKLNFSSASNRVAIANCVPCVTSKTAAEAFTRLLAGEFSPGNIGVNAILLWMIEYDRLCFVLERIAQRDRRTVEEVEERPLSLSMRSKIYRGIRGHGSVFYLRSAHPGADNQRMREPTMGSVSVQPSAHLDEA